MLHVKRMRQRANRARHDCDEIRRLPGAGLAEREEVIGAAIKARAGSLRPVVGEARVHVRGALCCFDVGESDIVAGQRPPIDGALMMRNVNAPCPYR